MLLANHLVQFLLGCIILAFSYVTISASEPLSDFGDNPGQLTASYHAPDGHGKNLVVLLHGCAQEAGWLANQTGLQKAASQKGFVLLLPQQLKTNNMQLCFNWFSPEDTLRDKGETLSLMNMINTLKKTYALENTYLIGLSAGGSMVTSLVAQYPSEISAAAVIAGVGFPCADNLVKALSCMKNGFSYPIETMVSEVKDNSTTEWPGMVLIAGREDSIVNPMNTEQMAKQWQQIMAIDTTNQQPAPEGVAITRYQNASTKSYVELVLVNGIGHGWPINSKQPFGGEAAPFVLESPFSATDHLVSTWGF